MVWQHQADKLGIVLTDTDLTKELKREAAGQDIVDEKAKGLERDPAIANYVKNREYGPQTTPRDLVDALREEFRVVMAQELLLGSGQGVRSYLGYFDTTASPAVGTPDEFLRYYREQRTTLRVKMLDVPVTAFLDKVQGEPTEKELLNRYELGREREPAPYLREPGFKEPRRIAVEYVTASPDDPYYRELARAYTAPQTLAASMVGLAAIPAFAGPGAVPAILVDPYRVEYENYQKERRDWLDLVQGERPPQISTLHMSSVLQSGNLAAMVGSLSSSIQGGQNPFAASTTLYGTATFSEVRESLKVNLGLLLARANTPVSAFSEKDRGQFPTTSPLTTLLLTMPLVPKPLPEETLKPQLQASMEKSIAQRVLRDNLDKMRDELRKLKGKETKTVRDYIDKAVKDYHLTRQAMAKPLPALVMVEDFKHNNDLNIGPLEKAYLERNPLQNVEQFVLNLFRSSGVYDPESVPTREPGDREFVYWRTEDKPARVREFKDIRGEVTAAWRLEAARKLARREAERLEAEIDSKKWSPEDAERFLREHKLGEIFELNNVAQLVPPSREVMPRMRTDFMPYQIPADLADKLTYPPADLVKHLLTLKRPGEATVIADLPAKNFYVAVLFDRSVPTLKEFEEVYRQPPSDSPLYDRFADAQREEHLKAVLHQLRFDAAAGKLDKDGRFALPESYRKRIEGGQGTEE